MLRQGRAGKQERRASQPAPEAQVEFPLGASTRVYPPEANEAVTPVKAERAKAGSPRASAIAAAQASYASSSEPSAAGASSTACVAACR